MLTGACAVGVTRKPKTAANGHYSVDTSSTYDARGDDVAMVRYTSPQGDRVTAQEFFAHIGINPTVSEVFGCVRPGQDFTVRLFNPGGRLLEKHKVVLGLGERCLDDGLVFTGAFKQGRQLTASFDSDAKITIPKASVTNVGTMVTARCLPSRPILIEWFTDVTHHLTGTADSTGRFVRDLATDDPTVNPSGLEVRVHCETSKDDRVEYARTLPA